jgi:phage regulator Rha-like protein
MTESSKKIIPLLIHGTSGHITVDSRNIADVFERPHKNVLQTIDALIEEGTISRLEFKPSKYVKRGKEYRCVELNEAGFLKAMPFIGGKKSKEGQKRLVDEFLSLRKRLDRQSKERESFAFQMVRLSGKDARKLLANEIQKFVDYAKLSGSNNAGRYYSIITQTVYSSFLIVEPKADKIRELLTAIQLSTLQTAELIAADVLVQGMENNLNYKDIYQQLKKELEVFVAGRTKILGV